MNQFLIYISGALLCFSFALLSGCSDSTPIVIGFSGQLTGKMSDLGVSGRNGVTLAVEYVNANGGINGRPLQLIAKDDKNTPEGALDADKELIDMGAVAIIGHMTSSQTMAVMPLINQTGIVMVSPTTATPQLSRTTDSFFRTMVENTKQSSELADYARSALDVKTVATIAEQDNKSFTVTYTNGFLSTFTEMGGTLLKSFSYSSSNNTELDKIIDSLVELRPDAILITCPAHDAVIFAQRIRSSGLKSHLLSAGWAYTQQLLQWGGTHVEDMFFAFDYAADNPHPNFIKFRELYKSRFGRSPNFASAFSYEAVIALAAGLKKTNGSSKGLVEAMAPSDTIKGIIGDFKLDPFGDVDRNVFIVTVEDGSFRTVEMR